APTTSYWSAGHGDIDMHEHTPGDWEIHYHFHAATLAGAPTGGGSPAFPGTPAEAPPADPEYAWKWEAPDLTTWINTNVLSPTNRPSGTQWDFTGVSAGQPLYILPTTSTAGLPYLGFSAEDHPFDVVFTLGSVTGGAISAWTVTGGGEPIPYWSSSSSGSTIANNSFTIPAGSHSHVFLGFSQLGDYTAVITAVPEPGSLGLAGAAGLGLAAFAWIRRRRG
ncbi:MAG: PEP-CTERM sorting domain-containing protein, partial [Planctomycetia bacterium]